MKGIEGYMIFPALGEAMCIASPDLNNNKKCVLLLAIPEIFMAGRAYYSTYKNFVDKCSSDYKRQ
jgi:hypothetical protein